MGELSVGQKLQRALGMTLRERGLLEKSERESVEIDQLRGDLAACSSRRTAAHDLLRESNEEFLVLLDTDDPTVYNDYLEHLKGIQSRIAALLATSTDATT